MKTWIPVKEFSKTNRIVHHISAVMFIGALLLMAYDQYVGSSDAMLLHQSFGVVVFVLYFGRIVLMGWFGKPEALGTQMEQFLAHMAHLALYGILLLMPLSGLMLNIARARDTVVFGLFTIPGFSERNMDIYLMALDVHSFLEWICYLLLFAHVGASMFHHFVLKDDTLKRMWGKTD
ncbi:cytochrome b [Thalassotalea sp. Y01]|uniref:cytochrome b n=1 Tax=Thalassotalea sp. Y01 TaxID=2729613 RepID=UPI00145E61DE|nr:cytochrome b [Thalassotalea sp. Y01]NMP17066.1 cytochrome b [Thalassotalea sp. Y01]